MDRYTYRAGRRAFYLDVMPYEAHMLSRVDPTPSHERGVLAVHKSGIVNLVPREELVEKGQRLLAVLKRDHALLQFRYGLREAKVDGGKRSGGGGGHTCRFRGENALAEAGAGYCRIVGVKIRTVERRTIVEHRVLHDLRDMKPVALDDGTILQAERRRRTSNRPACHHRCVGRLVSKANGPDRRWHSDGDEDS